MSHIYYTVSIDNGADYVGPLYPATYATEQLAEDAGNDWLEQFYCDNGILDDDREDCEAHFDIYEHECEGCEECCSEDCEGCANCYEDQDPKSMGWVGKDGRP